MNNPYTSRGPLFDARMFCGRMFELNEIGAFLGGSQSVSIVGPRKIGKTSLMLHLMRAETIAALGIGRENLFAYIDCQALSNCPQEEIFACFCTEIDAALRTQDLEPEPAVKAAFSEPTWIAFDLAMRKLNQRGLRIVLMLDEFEQLTINPHVDVSFYNALRSAAGRRRLAFLTASAQPLIELTYFDSTKKILSSPFFNIFAQLFLGLLSRTEAGNLIRTPMEAAGMRVSPQLEDFIYQLVGGNPFALQIACFHAWDCPEDFQKIELQTTQELEAHFQYYWHNLSPSERDVLRHPAEAGLHAASNPALAILLRDLTHKCLLVPSVGSYLYPSKAWAEFVSVQMDEPETPAPVDPPVQVGPGEMQGPVEDIGVDLREQAPLDGGSKTVDHTFRRVMRESLPEAIGGLVAALIIGLAGLIYAKYNLLIEMARSIYAGIGPAGLVLATLGILLVGIAAVQIALRRKRGRAAADKSAKGI